MRRVYEEKVARAEALKEIERNLLDGFFNEADSGAVFRAEQAEKAVWIGLNAGDGDRCLFAIDRVEHDCGGETGADFNDALGLLVADEGGEKPGVSEGEPVVLVMVAEALRGVRGEGQRIGESEETGEEGALRVEAEIDVFPEFSVIVRQVRVTFW
jgi:hypothetical protein